MRLYVRPFSISFYDIISKDLYILEVIYSIMMYRKFI